MFTRTRTFEDYESEHFRPNCVVKHYMDNYLEASALKDTCLAKKKNGCLSDNFGQ